MEPARKSGDARLRLILSGLLFSLSVLLLVPTGTSHSQGGQDRIVDVKGSYPGCPIKIVSIRTNGKLMPIGKPVSADADWIRNLSIEVENISTSVITHIGVRLDFARPSYQSTQPDAVFDLEYGVNPFAVNSQKNPVQSPDGVNPHAKTSLSMSDSDYSFLQRFLSEVEYPPSLERVHVFVNTVGFADGNAWRGMFLIPDPNAPGRWKAKEMPIGGIKPMGNIKKSSRARGTLMTSVARARPMTLPNHTVRPYNYVVEDSVDEVPRCGRATVAETTCPGQPAVCVHELVGEFDDQAPTKPDAMAPKHVGCYVWFGGQKQFGCGYTSSPVPTKINCPSK